MRIIRWLKKKHRAYQDMKLFRDKVGEDKYGNEYYQYYSRYGLPTKKEIQYVNWDRLQQFQWVAFFAWLRGQVLLPPTESELKQYYIDERTRKINALKYNKINKELDEQYYKKKLEINELWNPKPIGAEDFKPDTWEPQSKRIDPSYKKLKEAEKYAFGENQYEKEVRG